MRPFSPALKRSAEVTEGRARDEHGSGTRVQLYLRVNKSSTGCYYSQQHENDSANANTVHAMGAHRLLLPLLLLLQLGFGRGENEESSQDIESENAALRKRLEVLEGRLKEEQQYSYVVAKGYLTGAETIYMETMEVAQAKIWCNANENCKGD